MGWMHRHLDCRCSHRRYTTAALTVITTSTNALIPITKEPTTASSSERSLYAYYFVDTNTEQAPFISTPVVTLSAVALWSVTDHGGGVDI